MGPGQNSSFPLKVTSYCFFSTTNCVIFSYTMKWQTYSILILIVFFFLGFLLAISINSVYCKSFGFLCELPLTVSLITKTSNYIFLASSNTQKQRTYLTNIKLYKSWHLKSCCPILNAVQCFWGFSLFCGDSIGSCLPKSAASWASLGILCYGDMSGYSL